MKTSIKDDLVLKGFKFFPKTMLKIYYKKIFNQKLNLKNPIYYSEKLQWLKFYYAKNELAIKAGDKAGIHEYLKIKNLEHLLVPVLGIYKNVEDIDWENLPNKFVMKKSNASGMNIIINNKEIADKEETLDQMKAWMNKEFGVFGAEKHYSKMDSKIVIENYLENISEDWRIIFLNGKPKMINVSKWLGKEKNNYVGHRDNLRIFADVDGKIRHFVTNSTEEYQEIAVGDYLDLPKDFDLMIKYGEKIAEDFPLVRVDYFYANNQLFIGELTFTPGSGYTVLTKELQDELGNELKLPKER